MTNVKKNAYFYAFSSYAAMAIGFITSLVTIRYVDIGLYGAASHVKAAALLLQPFVWLGTDQLMFRIIRLKTKNIIFGILVVYYILMSLLLTSLVVFIPKLYVGELIHNKYSIAPFVFFGLIISSLIQGFISNIGLTFERGKIIAFSNIFLSLVSVVSGLFLILYKNINISMWAVFIGYLVYFLLIVLYFRKKLLNDIKLFISDISQKQLCKEAFRDLKKEFNFVKYFSLSSVFGIMAKRITSIYFANSGNTPMLAILSLFNQMSDSLQSVAWSINNSWGINRLKAQLDHVETKTLKNIKSLMNSFYNEADSINYILISLFLLLSPIWITIFHYIVGRWHISYPLAISVLTVVIVKYVFDFVGTILQHNYLYITEKLGKQIFAFTLINACLTPVNLILVERYSIYGAIFATLLPGLAAFVVGEFFLRELRSRRFLTIFISIAIFVPISFAYIPGHFLYTAIASIVLSVLLLTVIIKLCIKHIRYDFYNIILNINTTFTKIVLHYYPDLKNYNNEIK